MGRDLQQRPGDTALEIAKFEHQVGLVPEQRHAVREEPHGKPRRRRLGRPPHPRLRYRPFDGGSDCFNGDSGAGAGLSLS